MKNRYSILSIAFMTCSLMFSSERKHGQHQQVQEETPSLQVTQLLPDLQQTVIDYFGYDKWKLSKVISGHSNRINTVNICSAKSILASGSNDETVKIWDIKTGNCINTIKLAGKVDYVSMSRDGRLIVIIFSKRYISVYDLEQNSFILENLDLNIDYTIRIQEMTKETPKEQLDELPPEQLNQIEKNIFEALPNLFSICSISINNQFLAYYSHSSILKLWDLKTKKCLLSLYSQKEFEDCVEKDSLASVISKFIKIDEWDAELGNSYKSSPIENNSKSNKLKSMFNSELRKKGEIYLVNPEITINKMKSLNLNAKDCVILIMKSHLSVDEVIKLASDKDALEIRQKQNLNISNEEIQKLASILKSYEETKFALDTGDKEKINAVVLSADGKYLAVAVDNDVKIWDNQIQQLLV